MANIKKIQLPSGLIYDIYDDGAARKEDLTELKDEIKSEILGAAPEELNTLEELAAALGTDANFSTTVLNQIGNKVDKIEGKGLSTEDFTTEEKERLATLKTNTQGDWNINDINNPAYIKNKTHYIDASGNYIPLDEKFIPESIRNKQNKINSGYTLPSYAEVGTIFLLLEEE